MVSASTTWAQSPPPILRSPTLDTAPILDWPTDRPKAAPNLSDPNSNLLFDLHGDIQDCSNMDLVFSTEGNYHMALRELWQDVLLPQYGADITNWYYTTSPPVFVDQIKSGGMLEIGNTRLRCIPSIVVGGTKPLSRLVDLGVVEGSLIPMDQSRGVVILVKKGNPKHLQSVWDLGRPDVRVVTPNPALEAGAFDTYRLSIYGIALNDPSPPTESHEDGDGMDDVHAATAGTAAADRLYNRIFNNAQVKDKWVAGARIHHRDVPWSIALGRADAGVILYHLAKYTVEAFPDKFEIVPLGGTAEDPRPLPGTSISKAYVALIRGSWTSRQLRARHDLLNALLSSEFTRILEKHGLQRQ